MRSAESSKGEVQTHWGRKYETGDPAVKRFDFDLTRVKFFEKNLERCWHSSLLHSNQIDSKYEECLDRNGCASSEKW